MLKKEPKAFIFYNFNRHSRVRTGSLCKGIHLAEDMLPGDLQRLAASGIFNRAHVSIRFFSQLLNHPLPMQNEDTGLQILLQSFNH
jgi:hypothetical protein